MVCSEDFQEPHVAAQGLTSTTGELGLAGELVRRVWQRREGFRRPIFPAVCVVVSSLDG